MNINVIHSENVTRAERGFRIRVVSDELTPAPWKHFDTLGEVTEWTHERKPAGSRVLNEDRHASRYYDFAGAVRTARSQGMSGPDAVAVAEQEFNYLRRWCSDEWCWVGVVVTPLTSDGDPLHSRCESLWGIESDAENYIQTVADGMIDYLIQTYND